MRCEVSTNPPWPPFFKGGKDDAQLLQGGNDEARLLRGRNRESRFLQSGNSEIRFVSRSLSRPVPPPFEKGGQGGFAIHPPRPWWFS